MSFSAAYAAWKKKQGLSRFLLDPEWKPHSEVVRMDKELPQAQAVRFEHLSGRTSVDMVFFTLPEQPDYVFGYVYNDFWRGDSDATITVYAGTPTVDSSLVASRVRGHVVGTVSSMDLAALVHFKARVNDMQLASMAILQEKADQKKWDERLALLANVIIIVLAVGIPLGAAFVATRNGGSSLTAAAACLFFWYLWFGPMFRAEKIV